MLKMHHDTVQTTPTTNDRRPLAPIPRILVVDRNHHTRELYRYWFQLSGCHVVEASDGRDALTKALVSPPSLVVTEISLPFRTATPYAKSCAATEQPLMSRFWS
jgi:CheY-like chemotaxis protein